LTPIADVLGRSPSLVACRLLQQQLAKPVAGVGFRSFR